MQWNKFNDRDNILTSVQADAHSRSFEGWHGPSTAIYSRAPLAHALIPASTCTTWRISKNHTRIIKRVHIRVCSWCHRLISLSDFYVYLWWFVISAGGLRRFESRSKPVRLIRGIWSSLLRSDVPKKEACGPATCWSRLNLSDVASSAGTWERNQVKSMSTSTLLEPPWELSNKTVRSSHITIDVILSRRLLPCFNQTSRNPANDIDCFQRKWKRLPSFLKFYFESRSWSLITFYFSEFWNKTNNINIIL